MNPGTCRIVRETRWRPAIRRTCLTSGEGDDAGGPLLLESAGPSLAPTATTVPAPRASPSGRHARRSARTLAWAAVLVGLVALAILGLRGKSSAAKEQPTAVVTGAAGIRNTEQGAPVRWRSNSVPLKWDPSLEVLAPGAAEALQAALRVWAETGSAQPTVELAEEEGGAEARQEGVNRVVAAPLRIPGHEKDLAATILYYDSETGRVVEADIVVNTDYPYGVLELEEEGFTGPQGQTTEAKLDCGGRYDLQSILTHEIGHFYGLGEDLAEPESSMYVDTGPCEANKRTLGEGDKSAIASLYSGEADSPGVSCAVRPEGSRRRGSVAGTVLVSGVLTWLLRRQARTRRESKRERLGSQR